MFKSKYLSIVAASFISLYATKAENVALPGRCNACMLLLVLYYLIDCCFMDCVRVYFDHELLHIYVIIR